MKNRNVDLLDSDTSPAKNILFLATPVILGTILQTIGQYVNVAMVGSLGATATASVSINASVTDMMYGIMNAIALGFSVLIAQKIGRDDVRGAKETVRQALTLTLVAGSLMTLLLLALSGVLPGLFGADADVVPDAVVYTRIVAAGFIFRMAAIVCSMILQFSGNTKTPTFYNILSVFLQVACNLFLIFPARTATLLGVSFQVWGAGLGVAGSGLSLLLSQIVNAVCQTSALFRKASPIRLTLRGNYRPDRRILSEMSRQAIPNVLERLTLSFAYIAITPLVAGIGTVALAANSLAVTVESMCYLPCFGFSVASTTLVAQSIGANRRPLAKQYIRASSVIAVSIMSLAGSLMFVFSKPLMSLFTGDAGVVALGALVLRIEAFAEPAYALASVLSGAFRGMGDARRPFYYSAIGMWGVRIVLSYVLILVFHMGLTGVWIGMMLDWNMRGALCVRRMRRLRGELGKPASD